MNIRFTWRVQWSDGPANWNSGRSSFKWSYTTNSGYVTLSERLKLPSKEGPEQVTPDLAHNLKRSVLSDSGMFLIMDRRKRRKSQRHFLLLLIGIICVSIVLQILGLPLSFTNLEGTSDLIKASHLEGISITSNESTVSMIQHLLAPLAAAKANYLFSPIQSFFHPPNRFVV